MWFEDLAFAPEIPGKRFTNVNEAVSYANDLSLIPTEVTLGDLLLNPDATVGEQHRKITRYGFERICSILGIPKPFARAIPNDLLFENIRRLKRDNQGTSVVVLSRENGEIATIVKAPYKEPSYGDMLAPFIERADLRYIDLGERLLTICIGFEDLVFSCEDDIFSIATYVFGSITKETSLKMLSGIYNNNHDLSFLCSALGSSKANYKHEDVSLLMSKFAELIRCYDPEGSNRMSNFFKHVMDDYMPQHQVAKVWEGMKKLAGKEIADNIIGFPDEDTRKEFLDAVKTWMIHNRYQQIKGEELLPDIDSVFKRKDVVHNIAFYAETHLHELEKRDVEKFAGNIIQKAVFNLDR